MTLTSLDDSAALLERAWSVIARRIPRGVRAIERTGVRRSRVVIVAPHPDDEVAGCAGTIVLHRRAGDEVTIVCATDGGASRVLKLPPAEMGVVRRREAERAAEVLDAKLEWIGLPEMSWSIDQLVPALARAIDNADLIYAPSRVDAHPEHFKVAHALALALSRAKIRCLVRAYGVYVPLTPILTNLALDVSSEEATIERAFAAHESQAHSLRRTLRLRRYAARIHGASVLAETYWELDAAAYARLHREPPDQWRERFFGIRLRAFRDPAAFMVGLAARRALASSTQRG